MRHRFTLAALAAATALAAGQTALAQQPDSEHHRQRAGHSQHGQHGHSGQQGHHGHHGPDGLMLPGGGMLRGLNLSEAQRDKVFSLMHAQAPTLREHMRAARNARDELQKLAFAGDLDEGRLQAAAQRASRAMADLALLRTRTHNAVFKELTPEQQAQLRARLERRGHDGRHGRQHSGHGAQAS